MRNILCGAPMAALVAPRTFSVVMRQAVSRVSTVSTVARARARGWCVAGAMIPH